MADVAVSLANVQNGRRLYATDTHVRACKEDRADDPDCERWRIRATGSGAELRNASTGAPLVLGSSGQVWRLDPFGQDGPHPVVVIVSVRSADRLFAHDKDGDNVGLIKDGPTWNDQLWKVVGLPDGPLPIAPALDDETAGLERLLWSSVGLIADAACTGLEPVLDVDFGRMDPESFARMWEPEQGWKRNEEDQFYMPRNAHLAEDALIIEARREDPPRPAPTSGKQKPKHGGGWTSASFLSRFSWCYGLLEVEARLDCRRGFWPAIWTTGAGQVDGGWWPHGGEVDLCEFYHDKGGSGPPIILANAFWGQHPVQDEGKRYKAAGLVRKVPLGSWPVGFFEKWHVWRMLWLPDKLEIWLDDRRLFAAPLQHFVNNGGKGSNPFEGHHQKLRLNLAVGGQCGGVPDPKVDTSRFHVRRVRLFQGKEAFEFTPPK